ncbi:Bax inhibitor-1/YccA family protein [Pedobacter gandavensis]|uniref:BAX inhibitor (BI)-1/YccA family protein n=1 Tax=Pedobacter gandavensis TaxID=2679963 RepID=A0ABR6EWZ7_9SPHI|nr:Bax inhibitor-1/YccA family protein [Pedobacter gandavensis]MBB2149808.1 BAX inhibitor (BI)-1/YccA family protein [Pedobacter gandavensis]
MDNNNNYEWAHKSVFVEQERGVVAKKFFANVFLWMFVALSLSTLAALFISNSPAALSQLINFETGQRTVLGYIAMFAPLGLVLLMGAGFSRLSYGALIGVFALFSILLGISLSFILLIYTAGSIAACFGAAAGIFGIMAFLGYTTDVDLTKFGPILMVGVAGLFIASLINLFLGSPTFSYVMSFFGVAIFTALTAYDVQKLKRIGAGLEESGDPIVQADGKKLAIMGALSLYLDFINIFIFLLRIFGSRK